MNKISFLDLNAQYKSISEEIQQSVARVLDSQQFILKDEVLSLEDAIAKDIGVKSAIGCASGSDALFLALSALGVGPGDEVITTPFTFFATAGAVSRVGAKPVFVDIEEKTFNLDPKCIEKAISKKTKAIIAVHLFGLCAEMDAIRAIAKKHSLYVIEDMAQSYGASYKGHFSGSMSDAACLSFFPTKNLGGSGDGGMVVAPDVVLADKIKLLRVHGSKKKYHHEVIGVNSRLDELQAAIVSVKMRYIHSWNKSRQKKASIYDDLLKGLPIQTPYVPQGHEHVYHLYSVLADKRDALVEHLSQVGIGVGVYYPLGLHLQPCYASLGYKLGDIPVAEKVCERVVSLPMYPELPIEHIEFVCSEIRKFYKG